jgi:hypothetical protein
MLLSTASAMCRLYVGVLSTVRVPALAFDGKAVERVSRIVHGAVFILFLIFMAFLAFCLHTCPFESGVAGVISFAAVE